MAQTVFKQEIDETFSNLTLLKAEIEEQYCRLCLSNDNTEFKQLFSPFNTTQSVVEVIEDFAKVAKISIEDEYSKLICINCFIRLTESESFKNLIVNSDFKLRNRQITSEDPLGIGSAGSNSGVIEEKLDVDEIDLKRELISNEIEQDESIVEISENFIKTENLENEENSKLKQNRERNESLTVKERRKIKPYSFKCRVCDRIFKWHCDLIQHLCVHTGVYPFHCSICSKGFPSNAKLQLHELVHSKEAKYQCEICGRGFRQHRKYICHIKTHKGAKPFKCEQCFKGFMSNHSLKMHTVNSHPSNLTDESNFPCVICKKQYKSKFHLQNHMRRYHKPNELTHCDVCGKAVKYYKMHMETHIKLYKCNECNLGFATSLALKDHLTVHTGQKLYECDICKKTFRFQGALHTHRKIHDVQKSFLM